MARISLRRLEAPISDARKQNNMHIDTVRTKVDMFDHMRQVKTPPTPERRGEGGEEREGRPETGGRGGPGKGRTGEGAPPAESQFSSAHEKPKAGFLLDARPQTTGGN